jgi:agmatinase
MSTLGHKFDNSLVSNAFGFLRFPVNFEPYDSDAEWVITGIPFDMATSGRSGSRLGPAAIRQVSVNLAWEGKRWPSTILKSTPTSCWPPANACCPSAVTTL